MAKPKIHHYVPQFLLREFVTGSRNQLHAFDKQTDRTFVTGIDRAAAESGFNNVDLESGVRAEEAFGVLERDAAPVFKRIIENGTLRGLTEHEREVVAIFVATQHLRTRSFREMLHGLNADMAAHLRLLGLDPSKPVSGFRQLNPSEIPAASLDLLRLVPDLAPMLLSKDWALISNRTPRPFYTSDNPVALENTVGDPAGMGVIGSHVSMPLSGSRLLLMMCPSTVRQSRRILRRSRWLGPLRDRLAPRLWPDVRLAHGIVQAVHEGGQMEADDGLVRHYNALRVQYANRYLYSGTDDFTLARDLLQAHPSLRTGPRVEVY